MSPNYSTTPSHCISSFINKFIAGYESPKLKSKLEYKLGGEGGYFRPESPYLPGSAMRRTDKPVDLEELEQNGTRREQCQQVKMKNVSASWHDDIDRLVIKDISLDVNRVSGEK